MKINTNNLKDQLTASAKQEKAQNQADALASMMHIVNRLFARLKIAFPAFRQSWGTDAEYESAKKVWAEALIRAGLTDAEKIKVGLNKCIDSKKAFVTTVGEFIEACTPTPEDLGIPNLRSAFIEACSNAHPSQQEKKWSHPIVYHAQKATGAYVLANEPERLSMPIFKRNYDLLTQQLIEGKALSEPPKAIAQNQSARRASNETAAYYIKKIHEDLAKIRQ